jgi:conjugal transfer pilus assembly protein TraL
MGESWYDIPRRLNDPPRLFWWDMDVAMIVLGAALAGMVIGFLLTGCLAGLLSAHLYARLKSGRHPAYALHLLYWHLPAFMTGLRRTPPSHQREWHG